MYAVVVKYGIGSWHITGLGKVYDDRERAASAARRLREEKADDPTLRNTSVDVRVVPLGDPEMWGKE